MRNKYSLLSYPLNGQTPLYGDTEPVQFEPDRQLSKGAACNTYKIRFSNHSGTHIDAPKHFFSEGKAISEYTIDKLIFNEPLVINCPLREDQLIMPKDLKSLKKCDLLLIRTGFYKYRGADKYRIHNPGISPKAAEWIRLNHPNIRALGFDAISISAFQKRDQGRRAHQILLMDKLFSGKPVTIIEDLDLSGNLKWLKRVFVVPLFMEGIDSSPCTVIGEFDQGFKKILGA